MLFLILIYGVIGVSLIWALVDAKNVFKKTAFTQIPGSKVFKLTFKEFFETFIPLLLIGGFLSTLLIGLLIMFFGPGGLGNHRVIAKTEIFDIAPQSQLEFQRNSFKFTALTKNNYLQPVEISSVDQVDFKSKEPKTVTVEYEDQYHTWLAPWNLSTETKVTIK